jgi:hypothetical protein
MTETPLPNPKDVRDMFSDLLGRDVSVNVADPINLAPGTPAYFAVYVDCHTHTAAVVVADLPLAAYTGAAIGLIPAGGAADAVGEGTLPKMLAENFSEVLNIAVGLFNVDGAPHLRLYDTYAPGEAPPPDVVANAKALGNRLDLSVAVTGYGSGALSMVVGP